MRIDTYGQQLEVTPALRDYVESKLSRLARHFDQPFDVRTQLSLERTDHCAEANVNIAGRTLHADATAQNMAASAAGNAWTMPTCAAASTTSTR